jgi:TonB family protein
MLPDLRPRWRAFSASVGVQSIALLLLIWIPVLLPQELIPVTRYSLVPLVAARPISEWSPEPPPKAGVAPAPAPAAHTATSLFDAPRLIVPKPRLREVTAAEIPAIQPEFEPVGFAAPATPLPRAPVQTGMLQDGSAPARVNRPAHGVQTGGFGDPNGLPDMGTPNRAPNVAHVGSFDLPPGAGSGNGTGGARGLRGTVVSTGFGNGVAARSSRAQGTAHGVVQAGAFGDVRLSIETAREPAKVVTPSVEAVEIISKVNPVYTAEALQLRLEGEVQLEVVFTAGGEVRVLRVVKGLGHGLDEAAVAAARQIRFKPERVNGQPVDSAATVHIVFQLAY